MTGAVPRIVKSEVAQDLTDLLPVLEPRSLSPDEVSSTLQLTQPLLPGTHKFRSFVDFNVQNAAGIFTAIVFPTTNQFQNQYLYIHSVDVLILVAVAVNRLAWFDIGPTFPIPTAVYTAVGGPPGTISAVGVPHSLPLRVLLPPGWQIRARLSGIDATGVMQMSLKAHAHLILDPHPNF